MIQIGVKSEFRQNLGRIGLFYGNKTAQALQNFQPQLSWGEDNQAKLMIMIKPVDPVLEAGAQIQQLINAECISEYTGMRNLWIKNFSDLQKVAKIFNNFNFHSSL